jgi:predicted acylesterase/phospholipase RssA
MTRLSEETGLSGQQDNGTSQHVLRSNAHWIDRLRHLWMARASQAAKPAPDPQNTALAARDKVAFVLLGGGSRGAAQAGALAVALEHGIKPDVIIGVSAGAWNGAYLAVDPTPERAQQLCAIWAGLKTADLLGGGWWRAAISAVSGRPALYGSEGPVRVARRYLDRQTFEELKTPLYILAANLTNGQPKLFSSGRIVPAMLASSAVPGVFPPVVLDGQVYADGGLLEWDACAEALRLGAQKIYLFACGAIGELSPRLSLPPEALENGNGKAPGGRKQITAFLVQQRSEPAIGATLLDVLERSWDVVSRFQFQRAVEGLRASGAEVISIEPLLPLLAHPLDFSRCQMMVDAGRASAEAVFQGSLLASAKAAENNVRIA